MYSFESVTIPKWNWSASVKWTSFIDRLAGGGVSEDDKRCVGDAPGPPFSRGPRPEKDLRAYGGDSGAVGVGSGTAIGAGAGLEPPRLRTAPTIRTRIPTGTRIDPTVVRAVVILNVTLTPPPP